MNTKVKYWIAAIALIVWLVLAWFIRIMVAFAREQPLDSPDCACRHRRRSLYHS